MSNLEWHVNGYFDKKKVLRVKFNSECRVHKDTDSTMLLIENNYHSVYVSDAELSITVEDLERMYKVIDNNPIEVSMDGVFTEVSSYYGDPTTNVIICLDNNKPDETGKHLIWKIFAPHGTKKIQLIKEAMVKYNIVKRDQV